MSIVTTANGVKKGKKRYGEKAKKIKAIRSEQRKEEQKHDE